MAEDKTITSRWAARKAAVLEEQQAQELSDLPEEPEPEKTEAEILAELGLKDPDEMVQGDDFSGFMREAVPAALRNRALRVLWRSNGALANLDGLLDYGEDFSKEGAAGGVVKTAYQVGKGFVKKLTEAEEAGLSDSELTKDEPEIEPEKPVEATRPPATKPDLAPVASEPVQVTEVEPAPLTAKKRMIFRFENN